jgi:hypothetical protein
VTDLLARTRWLWVQSVMRSRGWKRARAERWVDTQLAAIDREAP